MTNTEMTTKLNFLLEDTGDANFSGASKFSALNTAQRMVANLLHESYLTELEYKDTVTISGSSGLVTMDGASANNKSAKVPIRNSIRNFQTVISGTYRYAINIPFSDVKKLENTYLGADIDNPVFWVFGNNLHFRPITSVTSVVIYYLIEPADIDANNSCVLNVALHDIVVDLAESELWRMDNKSDRSALARQSAMDQIKILNDRYAIEAPTGVNK
tara:strand:- start:7184 stop:7831 length:648 start_codon:yes stop_codon:yes gene_type:complete